MFYMYIYFFSFIFLNFKFFKIYAHILLTDMYVYFILHIFCNTIINTRPSYSRQTIVIASRGICANSRRAVVIDSFRQTRNGIKYLRRN